MKEILLNLNNVEGKVFSRLTAIKFLYRNSQRHPMWLFKCECGNTKITRLIDVIQGRTKSCGCLVTDSNKILHTKHGESESSEYGIWHSMIQRCTNPNDKAFFRYGMRGITVCDRWLNSFPTFLLDMGRKPEGKSLDRIDNDGNYEPSNCRWATQKEQSRNMRRNRWIEYNGEMLILEDWATRLGIKRTKLRNMLIRKSISQIIAEIKT